MGPCRFHDAPNTVEVTDPAGQRRETLRPSIVRQVCVRLLVAVASCRRQ
jgi:hypothetical protein